ncbi:hypothetical protein DUI87_00357 [Hirundo rustica rustica]|uniref:Uncharacterized protein n=3 Tax=Passeriformes TaxID=9126 RepID=A0A3M0LAU9_HIRRU|nr:hypothetical protein DUI87_00357 [Hirundo rustica rustica]
MGGHGGADGAVAPEYPLEPGERPQPPPRRRSAGPRGDPPRGVPCRREAQRQVQVQLQVLEAARRLAAVPGLPPEQRRRRQRLQAEAAQRLRQLRAQLGNPGHDENGSLCELPALENGQLYGDVLYFATEARAGWTHSDPRPFYFWGYFVGLNGVWVLVPGLLLLDACHQLATAQRGHDRPRHKSH